MFMGSNIVQGGLSVGPSLLSMPPPCGAFVSEKHGDLGMYIKPHYIIVCARFNSWTCYSKSLWGRTLIGDILILKILQALLGISTC